jgi:hypothetical protein
MAAGLYLFLLMELVTGVKRPLSICFYFHCWGLDQLFVQFKQLALSTCPASILMYSALPIFATVSCFSSPLTISPLTSQDLMNGLFLGIL